jgi:hypothetical protein
MFFIHLNLQESRQENFKLLELPETEIRFQCRCQGRRIPPPQAHKGDNSSRQTEVISFCSAKQTINFSARYISV